MKSNILDWAERYETALQMLQNKNAADDKSQLRLARKGLKRLPKLVYAYAAEEIIISKTELEVLIRLFKTFPVLYAGSEAALLFLFRELCVYGKEEVRPLLPELAEVIQNKAVCQYIYASAELRNVEVFCEWLRKAVLSGQKQRKLFYPELAHRMRSEMLLIKDQYSQTTRRQNLLRYFDL